MDKTEQPASKTKKGLQLLLKIVVTVACLWFVSTKISFAELGSVLATANPGWLLVALAVFVGSKIIASFRLNIYFKNIGLPLSEKENLKLFWLGMFYNLFLPGSITGDAYKVIVLSKRFNSPYKKTSAAVLLDRFSGLLALGLILAVYSFFVLGNISYSILLLAGAIASVFVLFFIIKRFFTDFTAGFWPTFFMGLGVQSLMVLSIYAILYALGIQEQQSIYIFIFLVAAVASVLPLTVGGGLGIREFVFYKGAVFLGVNEHTAIVISLVFYFITLAASLSGAVFIFRKVFDK